MRAILQCVYLILILPTVVWYLYTFYLLDKFRLFEKRWFCINGGIVINRLRKRYKMELVWSMWYVVSQGINIKTKKENH